MVITHTMPINAQLSIVRLCFLFSQTLKPQHPPSAPCRASPFPRFVQWLCSQTPSPWTPTALTSICPLSSATHQDLNIPLPPPATPSLPLPLAVVVFTNTVPIDAHRSIVRLCLARNFAGWEGLDSWARSAMLKILREDKAVVELLRPEAMRQEVSLQV